jgi:hypothetical protein
MSRYLVVLDSISRLNEHPHRDVRRSYPIGVVFHRDRSVD